MPARPQSHRLRTGRFSEPGRAYLVTAVVHNRQPLFTNFYLGRLLVTEFRRAHEQKWGSSIAWVIMPDHFHWLVQLEQRSLSQLMQAVKSRSTHTINRARNGTGAFWQNGYHDRGIRDGEDLRHLARYIIANPIRAGLVERAGDYPLWDACWL
ncbi:REP-associated tyrosine transposase [Pseudomonas sp. PAMC 25886]|jgi:REP element-mobilizing transposase RayT|uniref:REP-associated tyrosine transposase n=1 Tax=Pseudomonas sp. PAMC 25886 TaxID=1125977 RepID=UPI00028949BB|nr:transposase [Pseudomonas sp. PAMC 25886]